MSLPSAPILLADSYICIYHLLGCGHNNLRIRRHDTLSDVRFHALLVDNANCRREQRCSSDNSTRPGDVFHPDFDQGRPTYFDIKVRNSLQLSYIVQAAHHAVAAAETGEKEKEQHHEAHAGYSNRKCFSSFGMRNLWTLVTAQFAGLEVYRTTTIFQRKPYSQQGYQ